MNIIFLFIFAKNKHLSANLTLNMAVNCLQLSIIMKNSSSLLLVLGFVLFSALGIKAQTTFTADGINYSVNADGKTVTMTGGNLSNYDGFSLRDVTDGTKSYTVTAIGKNAFKGYKMPSDIFGFTLPATVKIVEESAFEGSDIHYFQAFGGDLEMIGKRAFADVTYTDYFSIYTADCTQLTTIGEEAFAGSTITSLQLGPNVNTFGDNAFKDCKILNLYVTSRTLPNVGEGGFPNDIEAIDVPIDCIELYSNSKIFGDQQLRGQEMPVIRNIDYVTYCLRKDNTAAAYRGVYVIDSDFEFPAKVNFDGCDYPLKDIYSLFFGRNNANIRSITIPEGVEVLSSYAFLSLPELTSIEIPSTATNIGDGAFGTCPKLPYVKLPEGMETIPPYLFQLCSAMQRIDIPSTVKKIEQAAFYKVSNLSSIVIPEGVENIPEDCFYGCTSLKEVVLPPTVTSFGRWCFQATGFEEFTVPAQIEVIPDYFLADCANLKKLYIGPNVKALGMYIVRQKTADAKSISVIEVNNTTPPAINANTFWFSSSDQTAIYRNTILYVPKGASDTYRAAAYWCDFQNIEEKDFSMALDDINADGDIAIRNIYDINGVEINPLNAQAHGVYILKMSDGSTRKIVL